MSLWPHHITSVRKGDIESSRRDHDHQQFRSCALVARSAQLERKTGLGAHDADGPGLVGFTGYMAL
jgi:hypothetical protein